MHIVHPFDPIFNEESQALILGTFPSIRSRELGFYYGHPQNRFWKIIAAITKTYQVPQTIDGKKFMLLKNRIALWDILQSCNIEGSSDHSIRNTTPTDLSGILNKANIKCIYTNGLQSYRFFIRYYGKSYSGKFINLPSTSSSNAMYTLEQLVIIWTQIVS
ncbi:MAG: DNA-deoxyinosine glycosylase [Holosporales bacterium]|jgi:hypoxanthine-DNA glycosylase|nr:DNA-deoxyinosine glycosylase [Holosporales bacterium]